MRSHVNIALKVLIRLFAGKPSHPFVPLGRRTAGAHSEGQRRRFAGASRAPLTAASTLAGLRHSGDRALFRYAIVLAVAALSCGSGSGIALAQSAPIVRSATARSLFSAYRRGIATLRHSRALDSRRAARRERGRRARDLVGRRYWVDAGHARYLGRAARSFCAHFSSRCSASPRRSNAQN